MVSVFLLLLLDKEYKLNTEEDRVISKAQQVHYLAGIAQLESILQALLNEFDDDLYMKARQK